MALPLDQHENVEQLLPDEKQSEIKRRQYLLILILIQWIVFVITLGFGIYSVLIGNATDSSSGFQSLMPYIVFNIYYTFGLLVTYQKNRIGLLIFASIGIVLFIAVCIFLGYVSLAVVGLTVGFGGTASQLYKFIIFMVLFFVVMSSIAIGTIKLSFDLAKSIKLSEYVAV